MKTNKYILFQEAFKAKSISKTLAFLNKEVTKSEAEKFKRSIRELYAKLDIQIDKIEDKYLDYTRKDNALKITSDKVSNERGIHSVKYWFSLEDGYLGSTVTTPYALRDFYKGQWVKYDKNGEEVYALVEVQDGVAEDMIKIRVGSRTFAISKDRLTLLTEKEIEKQQKEIERIRKEAHEAKLAEQKRKREEFKRNFNLLDWTYVKIQPGNRANNYISLFGGRHLRCWYKDERDNYKPAILIYEDNETYYITQNESNGDTLYSDEAIKIKELSGFNYSWYWHSRGDNYCDWPGGRNELILKIKDDDLIDQLVSEGGEKLSNFEEPEEYPAFDLESKQTFETIEKEENAPISGKREVPRRNEAYKRLKTGQRAIIKWSDIREPKECVIYNEWDNDRRIYVIHNTPGKSGSSPAYSLYENGRYSWQKYGNSAWCIFSNSVDNGHVKIWLDNSNVSNDFDINDIYLEFNRLSVDFNPQDGADRIIHEADFAVILYLDELLKGEDLDTTKIKSHRKEQTSGAVAFMSNDAIKRANMKRYVNILVTKMGINAEKVEELNNLNGIVMKILGGDMCLFKILYHIKGIHANPFSNLQNISHKLFQLMQSIERADSETDEKRAEEHKKSSISYYDNLEEYMKDVYLHQQEDIGLRIRKSVEDWEKSDYDNNGRIELLHKFVEISKKLADKIRKYNISSLLDLEILIQDFRSLQGIWGTRLFQFHGDFRYAVEEAQRGYPGDFSYYLSHLNEEQTKNNMRVFDNWDKYIDKKF